MSGKVERQADLAAARHVRLLAALLDHRDPPWHPDELPPLGHWLLFPPETPQSGLGPDGHPAREDAVFPRRMWAGSRIRFLAPIPLGREVTRETTIATTADKVGRSGRMRFVTLRHELSVAGGACLIEEQDIVYRESAIAGAPAADAPVVPMPPLTREMEADPVQLFRFSALTFNAHRIHYDRDYATKAEGYPALVVHGPYLATLLMDHYLRHNPAQPVAGFTFRALRPLFDGMRFTLGLTPSPSGGDLVAIDSHGAAAMEAKVDAG